MDRRLLFVLMLLATSGATRTLWAQSVCRPADSLSALFKQEITRYSAASTADELVVRDSLRLASASPSQVVLATQETVCKKANAAYKSKLDLAPGSSLDDVGRRALANPERQKHMCSSPVKERRRSGVLRTGKGGASAAIPVSPPAHERPAWPSVEDALMPSSSHRRTFPIAGIALASVLFMSDLIAPPGARAQSPKPGPATSPPVSEGERALLGRSAGPTPAATAPATTEESAAPSRPVDGARALRGRAEPAGSR